MNFPRWTINIQTVWLQASLMQAPKPALPTPPPLTLPKGPGCCVVHIKHTLVSAASAITVIHVLMYNNDMRVPIRGQIPTTGEWSEANVPNSPLWFLLICRIRTKHLYSPILSQNVTVWPYVSACSLLCKNRAGIMWWNDFPRLSLVFIC